MRGWAFSRLFDDLLSHISPRRTDKSSPDPPLSPVFAYQTAELFYRKRGDFAGAMSQTGPRYCQDRSQEPEPTTTARCMQYVLQSGLHRRAKSYYKHPF